MTPLPLWLNILLMVGPGAAGAADAGRVARKWPDLGLEKVLGKARYLYALLALLLVLFGAHLVLDQRHDLYWLLPLWLELYYTAIVWGTIIALFSFLFGFAITVAFRSRHRERVKLAVAACLLIGAVQFAQWRYSRPLAPELGNTVTPEGIVMQSSGVSCAAASGANIARALGLEKSERDMATLFGTTASGTSAAQVVRGFESLGVECEKRQVEPAEVARLRVPAMLFVDHPSAGPESHAVAAFEREGEIRVYDPLTGSPIGAEVLARSWHGRAVECRLRE
jgi:hypothetical protein